MGNRVLSDILSPVPRNVLGTQELSNKLLNDWDREGDQLFPNTDYMPYVLQMYF